MTVKGERRTGPLFVHEQGLCESTNVGAETRIWAFAHILPGASIGNNCNICDHVFVENDVVIGDDVTIKSGVQLWDGVRLGNRVFIGPNATFTNDPFPRSKKHPREFQKTVIEDGASIGANATILPGLKIGRYAMVGAGAVVTKNVPPNAVVVGNPAVITGYQVSGSTHPTQSISQRPPTSAGARVALDVGKCELIRLPNFGDMRGNLVPLEFGQDLPFLPRRSFLVYDVPSKDVRGEHAHQTCHQLLVAVHGSLAVVLDDATTRKEIRLDDPSLALHLTPMVWGIQYKFEPHTALLVLASHPYDPEDYIRDYDAFRSLVGEN